MKRYWLISLVLSCFIYLSACTTAGVILQTAPSKPKGLEASPPITVNTLAEWEQERANLKKLLERDIYGPVPDLGTVNILSRKVLNDAALNGKATVEEITLNVAPSFNEQITSPRSFRFVLVSPNKVNKPVPIIMMETFCPNHATLPFEGISKPDGAYFDCSGGGMMGSIFGYVFGRYITSPPIEMIINKGYALATTYSSEFVPDNSEHASPILNGYASNAGAIALWAYQFSAMSKVLKDDDRFNASISYGHSRYGKSALVAAAYDSNIDAVISHQSGTGGASLTKGKPGETRQDITQSYPHWFTQHYAQSDPKLDQHHLLALIAPSPVFLGNAKRDVWSDPEGAYRAVIAADKVYELYNKAGLSTKKLTEFKPDDTLAFWMRAGTHGVVKEDWPAFLQFLDAHFK